MVTLLRHSYDVTAIDWSNVRTIVDVGASAGAVSMWLANRAPDASIVSLEPNPQVARRLAGNIRRNKLEGRVTTVAAAAGSSPGIARLVVEGLTIEGRISSTSEDGISVPVVTLRSILDHRGWYELDLLKLDCEGAEYDILLNADSDLLARVRYIVGEYHPHPAHDWAELRAYLLAAGYEVWSAPWMRRDAPGDESVGDFSAVRPTLAVKMTEDPSSPSP